MSDYLKKTDRGACERELFRVVSLAPNWAVGEPIALTLCRSHYA
jgi:hypothetical protein